jgi:hypothetical protein
MRKLLTIMNAMLKHSTPWNPNRLDLPRTEHLVRILETGVGA